MKDLKKYPHRLCIRIDEKTLENLKKAVKQSTSTTQSQYLRNVINNPLVRGKNSKIAKRMTLNGKVLLMIQATCNNANQIAKKLNSKQDVGIEEIIDNQITLIKLLNENLTELKIQNSLLGRFTWDMFYFWLYQYY